MSRLVCAIWFSNTIGIFAGDQEVHSSQQAADGVDQEPDVAQDPAPLGNHLARD